MILIALLSIIAVSVVYQIRFKYYNNTEQVMNVSLYHGPYKRGKRLSPPPRKLSYLYLSRLSLNDTYHYLGSACKYIEGTKDRLSSMNKYHLGVF